MHSSRRRSRLFACLSLPLLLLACGKSPAEQVDPYANGQSYPWEFQASGSLRPLTLGLGTNTLQYEPVLYAKNGWGPVEKNSSNGDQAAGDGKTLTLNGRAYALGFGTHANSELKFSLTGPSGVYCTRFTSDIGVDDEVGSRGNVVFQVFLDGVKAYDSGSLTGASVTKTVDLNVMGKKELRLVVTDAGDGISYDHADWADPRVSCGATAPAEPVSLSDLASTSASNGWGPVEKDRSNGGQAAGDGRTLTIAGQPFPRGLGVHSSSTVTYSLGGNCTTFWANVGVDDEVGDRGSVAFEVYGDDRKLFGSPVLRGSDGSVPVQADVTGVQSLKLVVTDAGDGVSYDHADWADPRVSCGSTPPPPPPADTAVHHLEYVAVDRAIKVYDIDQGYKLVKTISMPNMYGLRGIAANAVSDRLYIPYWGDRGSSQYAGQPTFGYLVALDLRTDQVVWTRKYSPSIDSLAITPDGKKLYMPSGEDYGSDFWFVLDGATGSEITRIPVFKNAHNTIVGASGKRVYMASISSNYLTVADTATDQVTLKVGPFFTSGANSGIRPFTVNQAETLAFVNVDHFSGFEIGDLTTGKKLYSVPVQGFPWVDSSWPITQSHGVGLTPNEKEAWVLDSYNRYVHIFDVSGLPSAAPKQIADIDVRDLGDSGNLPKWVNFTRDGRYAQLSTGHVIDVATRKIVTKLDNTRYYLQVDMQGGEPVQAYSRSGVGYAGVPTP